MPQVTGLASTLGRWQCADTEFLLSAPLGFEPDPAIVRAIRTFDPYYVPAFVVKEYVTPGGTVECFVFHVIGKWEQAQSEHPEALQVIGVTRPDDFPFKGGVVYAIRVWSDPPNAAGQKLGLPDAYRPFDWRIHRWMQAAHFEMFGGGTDMKKKVMQSYRNGWEAEERELERVNDNARQGLIEDRHQMAKAIGEGRITDPIPDPTPWVQVGNVGGELRTAAGLVIPTGAV